MACVDTLYVGDTGTQIRFDIQECDNSLSTPSLVPVDISTASNVEITFVKPDETMISRSFPDVYFVTNGTDGAVAYNTTALDLDQAGTWKAQAHISLPTGSWYSTIIKFKVKDNL